jgi:hypothetical protein
LNPPVSIVLCSFLKILNECWNIIKYRLWVLPPVMNYSLVVEQSMDFTETGLVLVVNVVFSGSDRYITSVLVSFVQTMPQFRWLVAGFPPWLFLYSPM